MLSLKSDATHSQDQRPCPKESDRNGFGSANSTLPSFNDPIRPARRIAALDWPKTLPTFCRHYLRQNAVPMCHSPRSAEEACPYCSFSRLGRFVATPRVCYRVTHADAGAVRLARPLDRGYFSLSQARGTRCADSSTSQLIQSRPFAITTADQPSPSRSSLKFAPSRWTNGALKSRNSRPFSS